MIYYLMQIKFIYLFIYLIYHLFTSVFMAFIYTSSNQVESTFLKSVNNKKRHSVSMKTTRNVDNHKAIWRNL